MQLRDQRRVEGVAPLGLRERDAQDAAVALDPKPGHRAASLEFWSWRGALAAALTPLRDGGRGARRGRVRAVRRLPRGAAASTACSRSARPARGSCSRSSERMRAAELFVDGGRLDVIVHCGAQSTRDTVELAAHAAEAGAAGVAVIAPPYFQLDERALLAHFAAAARACEPLPFYVYEFARASGYAVPLRVIERLRERVPNLVGMKVSDTPWDAFAPYLLEGLDVFVGPESLIAQGLEHGAVGAVSALASALPGEGRRRSTRGLHEIRARDRALPAARCAEAHRRAAGRADPRGRARAAARSDRRGANGARRVARPNCRSRRRSDRRVDRVPPRAARCGRRRPLRHGRDRIRRDRQGDGRRPAAVLDGGRGAARAGVDRVLSRARERRCSTRSATSSSRRRRRGSSGCAHAPSCSAGSACPSRSVDAAEVRGLRTDDVLGAVICREDGVADPAAVARELVRRAAERGVEVREHTDARELDARRARRRVRLAVGRAVPELPIRPLVRQLVDVGPVDALPATMPMVVEEETTFHFRRRRRVPAPRVPRADGAVVERPGRRRRARRGLCASVSRTATRPRPVRRSSAHGPASTT